MMATPVDNNIDIGTGARWLHLLTTRSTEVRGARWPHLLTTTSTEVRGGGDGYTC